MIITATSAKHLYNTGFYKCNDQIFYSKIQAVIYGSTVKKPVTWIYNDLIFNRYNWQIEPQETLDELYNKRARQLREKYDYLVISFSGGADSYNVVQSFIRQGLHIDEIVTNHLTKGTEKLVVLDKTVTNPWNLNAEHELQAIPRLKEIQNACPRTKITVLDTTDAVMSELRGKKDEEWILERKDNLTFAMFYRFNHFHFSSVKKQFDKNLSIAIVTGIDKPRTHLRKNKLFLTLSDAGALSFSGIHDHNEYPNATIEHFYWGGGGIDIMCKQSHVIKNWLTVNKTYQSLWKDVTFAKWRTILEPITRDIVYSTWNPTWFQVNKATGGWHTEFDKWAYSLAGNRELAVWDAGIQYVARSAPDYIQMNDKGIPDKLTVMEKHFYIGDILQ
jgi:hypothetical protein